MAQAKRVIDATGDLRDWDSSTYTDGYVIGWDANLQKFVGVPIVSLGEDAHYIHNQLAPSTEWLITHNLGKKPAVTVVDSADEVIIGDVIYLDDNRVRLRFSAGFSGKAYLN